MSSVARPFDECLRTQVAATPDALAIVHENRQWSYADLDATVNRLAARLIRDGVGRGQCVGICLPRCPEAIASMLAIHRAGAAFVPLDPEYPIERLRYMIEDAEIVLVISDEASMDATSGLSKSTRENTDPNWDETGWENVHDLLADVPRDSVTEGLAFPEISGGDLAYIMYTSGSTGKPKGVAIDHTALATYCRADVEVYRLTAADRTLQFSTLNFDIAIEEIFPPLMTGGAVVVRPSERSSTRNELSDLIDRHAITAIHLATAYWHEWVDLIAKTKSRVPRGIRLMIVTGEKVSVQHYDRWKQHCEQSVLWCNAYGPTEATVTATVFIPEPDFDAPNMPIGRPLPGYTARILDASDSVVRGEQTGQLFLGGPALAIGYWKRPDLTAAAFIDWPGDADHPAERLYRTGDVARWLPDGQIEFGGRVDHQIKLGSYRIEPAEMESVLNDHEWVAESLVTYDEANGQKFLVAYLATQGSVADAGRVDLGEVMDWLRDRLPPYMIPHRYIMMDQFPKTINGKIDRASLPSPSTAVVARRDEYVAPSTEIETELAAVWAETLNVPSVGIDDDFFELGGSSLLVTRVVASVSERWNVELPVRDFFANPTVALMAAHLSRWVGGGDGASVVASAVSTRDRSPELRPAFFESTDEQLFGVYYPAMVNAKRSFGPGVLGEESGAAMRRHGVVICGSYGHEQTRGYRNLQLLAKRLSQHGLDVFRFDYANTGNSSGDCESLTAGRMTENIVDACERLRSISGCQKLSVVGLRAGATLAWRLPIDDLESVVLWDPVVDGSAFVSLIALFHRHATMGLHRFAKKRIDGQPGQSLGYSMPDAKADSMASMLCLPAAGAGAGAGAGATRSLVLASDGYLEQEADPHGVMSSWSVREIADEIRWHDPEYTEAAFSSPAAFEQIISFLVEECVR